MKRQAGITLIALVITIIVLLILAGVSISAITGENGIVDKAKDATEKTEEAEKEEQDTLKGYEDLIDDATSNIITFTIEGVEYQAEKGMTWLDWLRTDYCKNEFVIYYGLVRRNLEIPDDGLIVGKNDPVYDRVLNEETIIANYDYIIIEMW